MKPIYFNRLGNTSVNKTWIPGQKNIGKVKSVVSNGSNSYTLTLEEPYNLAYDASNYVVLITNLFNISVYGVITGYVTDTITVYSTSDLTSTLNNYIFATRHTKSESCVASDNGSGLVRITKSSHGKIVGDILYSGELGYNGWGTVVAVIDADNFDVNTLFSATNTNTGTVYHLQESIYELDLIAENIVGNAYIHSSSFGTISNIVDYSSTIAGTIKITCDKDIATGSRISIFGTTHYDGNYTVYNISATEFYIYKTFVIAEVSGFISNEYKINIYGNGNVSEAPVTNPILIYSAINKYTSKSSSLVVAIIPIDFLFNKYYYSTSYGVKTMLMKLESSQAISETFTVDSISLYYSTAGLDISTINGSAPLSDESIAAEILSPSDGGSTLYPITVNPDGSVKTKGGLAR